MDRVINLQMALGYTKYVISCLIFAIGLFMVRLGKVSDQNSSHYFHDHRSWFVLCFGGTCTSVLLMVRKRYSGL